MLGRHLPPGQQTLPLVVEAPGLPGVVSAWVQGYFPPPQLTAADTLPVVPPSDPLAQNSVALPVVGIEPMPSQRDPAALLDRLSSLANHACTELRWITHEGTCRSLMAKLAQATRALEANRTAGARGELEAFGNELDAQHGSEPGKHVNDNAYWLLRINAEYILAHL
jgi:hypothetical protein